MRLVDMLVALSVSEDAIYPLIQSCVWAKIGGDPRLLKRVLDSFIRVSKDCEIFTVYCDTISTMSYVMRWIY